LKRNPIVASVLRIVLPYVALGAAWIVFSDRLLLALTDNPRGMIVLSTAKGWLYVVITGALLFVLVHGELRRRAELEAMLRDSIAEKGRLLSELNHRVKNNLQVIASILSLETDRLESFEARALSDRTRSRIRAMNIAYDRLFEGVEIGRLELGAYLRDLWEVMTGIYDTKKAGITYNLESIVAGADQAVPFGLFATEAITNAILYGEGPDGCSDVTIELRETVQGEVELMVRDRGTGIAAEAEGLGLRLMDALGAQLRGRVDIRNDGGTVVRLRFAAVERIGG
jgi:two-component system, sensor histidine kinase PdtaS